MFDTVSEISLVRWCSASKQNIIHYEKLASANLQDVFNCISMLEA